MSDLQCPICFTPLEVRDGMPCYICGGWAEIVKRLDPQARFHAWRLPTGKKLILCHACELEEFMIPGGWGNRLGLSQHRLPINDLQPLPYDQPPTIGKDKFCPQCNLRLAFLEIAADIYNETKSD